MKVVLIRHSKTAGNLMGRYIGTTDEPLCEEGIRLLENRSYPAAELVYVSPMKRCRETAALIYPTLAQREEPLLRECDFGDFENKNYLELNGNPDYQAWVDSCGENGDNLVWEVDSGGTLPFPGGESREGFQERCREGFVRILREAQAEKRRQIAVVAHGGTLMSVLSAFAVPEKPFYDWQVKNGRGFLLEVPEDFMEKRKLTVLENL